MFYITTNKMRFDQHDGIWPMKFDLTNMKEFDQYDEIWHSVLNKEKIDKYCILLHRKKYPDMSIIRSIEV